MARRSDSRALLLLVGRQIRAHRQAARLTQREVAAEADLDYKYFGGIERGTKNVTIDTLGRIAGALGVDAYQLLLPLPTERERLPDAARYLALLEAASPGQQQAILQVLETFTPYETSPPPKRRRTRR